MIKAELRCDLDKHLLDALDGYVAGHGLKGRTELVAEILGKWAEHELHAATILLRVAGRNPTYPASDRKD